MRVNAQEHQDTGCIVSSSINSTLRMTVRLWFSIATPVLVLGQVLCFPLELPYLSPSLGH